MATTENDVSSKAQAIQKAQPREPVPFAPRNFDDGWRQAQALARSTLVPKGLRGANTDETTANVMVALMWGNEIGVSPVQSMFNINVIHGRPSTSAALKVGLVKQAPECVYFQCMESTSEKATWETHRRGNPKPTRITFTADDARKAGLLGRQSRSGEDDNWTKWTATMLRWRAGAMLADAEYPDVTRGLGTQDEAPPQDASPVSAIPETQPVSAPVASASPAPTLERKPEARERGAEDAEAVPSPSAGREWGRPMQRVDSPEVADPDVVTGDDVPQDTGPDAVERETVAILEGAEDKELTREKLDALIKRAAALNLPPGDMRKGLEDAFRAATKRLKVKG